MAEATTVTHHPLPLGHHQRKKMMRAPHKGRANVWPHVHELTEAYYEAHSDVKLQDRKTHVCIECWKVLKLHKRSGTWINNVATKHLKTAHPELPVSKILCKADSEQHQSKIRTMLLVGDEMAVQKRNREEDKVHDALLCHHIYCTTCPFMSYVYTVV